MFCSMHSIMLHLFLSLPFSVILFAETSAALVVHSKYHRFVFD
jgi:hypothetical protein